MSTTGAAGERARGLAKETLGKVADRLGHAVGERMGTLGTPVRDVREAERAATIGRSRDEVYGFWRDTANVARVLPRLDELSATGDQRGSATRPAADGGWTLEVVEDRAGDAVTWRATTFPAADGPVEVSVRLRDGPGDLGTEVTMHLRFTGSGSAVSAAAVVLRALHGAKSLMETGEIPTLERNPAARPAGAPGGGR